MDKDDSIESVDIITYNYDIFLERILDQLNIRFCVPGIKNSNAKFKIYKPHGSISFICDGSLPKDNYNIPKEISLNKGDNPGFEVRYNDLSLYMPLIPIIPPAGEAHRYAQPWANSIQTELKNSVKKLQENDDFFICGISYWHVDRTEIDDILRHIDCDVNVRMINPGNVEGLSAILGMVFNNYIHHSSSEILKELI